jgi:hypothetical protein
MPDSTFLLILFPKNHPLALDLARSPMRYTDFCLEPHKLRGGSATEGARVLTDPAVPEGAGAVH